jgi:putative sigma-54 modulation protein
MKIKTSAGKKSRALARKAKRNASKRSRSAANVAVTFRHVDPSEALRTYAARKFAHCAKHLKRPCDVHLILTVDKYRQCGEVTVKSGRLALAAQEETKDLYSVIDLLADKIDRQLKSHLGRNETRKTRAISAGEILAAEEEV